MYNKFNIRLIVYQLMSNNELGRGRRRVKQKVIKNYTLIYLKNH